MSRLLHIFTLASILGLMPCYGHAAPSCSQVLAAQSSPTYAETISEHLDVLKSNLKDLRRALKDSAEKNNRLDALDSLKQDPRESAYVLQGAYRLLLAHPNSKEIFTSEELNSIEKGLRAMKLLEKTLGGYQVQADLYQTAKKLNLPSGFLNQLKKTRNEASENVIKALGEADYLDKGIPAVSKHLERLGRWKSKIESTEIPAESLQLEIDRVREKVRTEMKPLIMKSNYTHVELEFGAHAFRRSLRWLKVYVLAYPDYFAPRLDKAEFKLLNDTIDELRKIKKPGEMREKMTAALEEYGFWKDRQLQPGEAAKILESMMAKKFEDIELRTQSILKTYEDHDGFKHLLRMP